MPQWVLGPLCATLTSTIIYDTIMMMLLAASGHACRRLYSLTRHSLPLISLSTEYGQDHDGPGGCSMHGTMGLDCH